MAIYLLLGPKSFTTLDSQANDGGERSGVLQDANLTGTSYSGKPAKIIALNRNQVKTEFLNQFRAWAKPLDSEKPSNSSSLNALRLLNNPAQFDIIIPMRYQSKGYNWLMGMFKELGTTVIRDEGAYAKDNSDNYHKIHITFPAQIRNTQQLQALTNFYNGLTTTARAELAKRENKNPDQQAIRQWITSSSYKVDVLNLYDFAERKIKGAEARKKPNPSLKEQIQTGLKKTLKDVNLVRIAKVTFNAVGQGVVNGAYTLFETYTNRDAKADVDWIQENLGTQVKLVSGPAPTSLGTTVHTMFAGVREEVQKQYYNELDAGHDRTAVVLSAVDRGPAVADLFIGGITYAVGGVGDVIDWGMTQGMEWGMNFGNPNSKITYVIDQERPYTDVDNATYMFRHPIDTTIHLKDQIVSGKPFESADGVMNTAQIPLMVTGMAKGGIGLGRGVGKGIVDPLGISKVDFGDLGLGPMQGPSHSPVTVPITPDPTIPAATALIPSSTISLRVAGGRQLKIAQNLPFVEVFLRDRGRGNTNKIKGTVTVVDAGPKGMRINIVEASSRNQRTLLPSEIVSIREIYPDLTRQYSRVRNPQYRDKSINESTNGSRIIVDFSDPRVVDFLEQQIQPIRQRLDTREITPTRAAIEASQVVNQRMRYNQNRPYNPTQLYSLGEFLNGEGSVCNHFAQVLQISLQYLGIESRMVKGRFMEGRHAWVETIGLRYNYLLDPTDKTNFLTTDNFVKDVYHPDEVRQFQRDREMTDVLPVMPPEERAAAGPASSSSPASIPVPTPGRTIPYDGQNITKNTDLTTIPPAKLRDCRNALAGERGQVLNQIIEEIDAALREIAKRDEQAHAVIPAGVDRWAHDVIADLRGGNPAAVWNIILNELYDRVTTAVRERRLGEEIQHYQNVYEALNKHIGEHAMQATDAQRGKLGDIARTLGEVSKPGQSSRRYAGLSLDVSLDDGTTAVVPLFHDAEGNLYVTDRPEVGVTRQALDVLGDYDNDPHPIVEVAGETYVRDLSDLANPNRWRRVEEDVSDALIPEVDSTGPYNGSSSARTGPAPVSSPVPSTASNSGTSGPPPSPKPIGEKLPSADQATAALRVRDLITRFKDQETRARMTLGELQELLRIREAMLTNMRKFNENETIEIIAEIKKEIAARERAIAEQQARDADYPQLGSQGLPLDGTVQLGHGSESASTSTPAPNGRPTSTTPSPSPAPRPEAAPHRDASVSPQASPAVQPLPIRLGTDAPLDGHHGLPATSVPSNRPDLPIPDQVPAPSPALPGKKAAVPPPPAPHVSNVPEIGQATMNPLATRSTPPLWADPANRIPAVDHALENMGREPSSPTASPRQLPAPAETTPVPAPAPAYVPYGRVYFGARRQGLGNLPNGRYLCRVRVRMQDGTVKITEGYATVSRANPGATPEVLVRRFRAGDNLSNFDKQRSWHDERCYPGDDSRIVGLELYDPLQTEALPPAEGSPIPETPLDPIANPFNSWSPETQALYMDYVEGKPLTARQLRQLAIQLQTTIGSRRVAAHLTRLLEEVKQRAKEVFNQEKNAAMQSLLKRYLNDEPMTREELTDLRNWLSERQRQNGGNSPGITHNLELIDEQLKNITSPLDNPPAVEAQVHAGQPTTKVTASSPPEVGLEDPLALELPVAESLLPEKPTAFTSSSRGSSVRKFYVVDNHLMAEEVNGQPQHIATMPHRVRIGRKWHDVDSEGKIIN